MTFLGVHGGSPGGMKIKLAFSAISGFRIRDQTKKKLNNSGGAGHTMVYGVGSEVAPGGGLVRGVI